MIYRLIPLLLGLLLPSCATNPFAQVFKPIPSRQNSLVVDVSAKKAVIKSSGVVRKEIPVVTAYRGTGGRMSSRRTPLCLKNRPLVVISKEPNHRFGKVLRLGGISADGLPQDDRGILVHQTRWDGTGGCVGTPPQYIDLVFNSLDVGSKVYIFQ